MPDDRLYYSDEGEPRFADSVVLFLDLLGTAGRRTDDEALSELRRTKAAVENARRLSGDDPVSGAWGMLWFSDNLGQHNAITEPGGATTALGFLITEVGYLQWSFLEAGFVARGAVARGLHFFDGTFIHGPALERAVLLEKSRARYPRVVLDEASVSVAMDGLINEEWGAPGSPWREQLCVDVQDGSVFVDYLEVLSESRNVGSWADGVEIHQRFVTEQLHLHDGVTGVEEKYRWLAGYHNDFVERHVTRLGEGAVDRLSVRCARPLGMFKPFGWDVPERFSETLSDR